MSTDTCLTDTPQLQLRNTCEMMLRGHSQILLAKGISTGYPLDEFLEQRHHFQSDQNTMWGRLSYTLILGILGLRDAEELIGQ